MVGNRPKYELHFHACVQGAVVSDYSEISQRFQESVTQSTTGSAVHQLPPDLADFTGREAELMKITAWLRQATPSPEKAIDAIASRYANVAVVTGIAGVGKSALAIHAAHQLQPNFPDAQLYVNLRGTEGQPLAPLDVLAGFLRAWGVDDQSMPETLTERCNLCRSLLSGKRALVLLDDAHDETQVSLLLPGSPTCAVFVTSRKRLALEDAATLDLTAMTASEALELLRQLVGVERIQSEPEAAQTLVDLCDRLPLALRITGGTLRNKPNWRLEDCTVRLTQQRQRLAQLRLHHLDVRAALALSYQELDTLSARLFRLLGLLTGAKFSPALATALLESEPATAKESVRRLADVQLLEPATEGRYRFHDFVRLFAKEQLAQEEPAEARQAARLRAARWYLETSEIMNLALNPETRHHFAADLVEDLGQQVALKISLPTSPNPQSPILSPQSPQFLTALNWFEIERINLLASIQWAYQCQAWEIVVSLARNLVNFFSIHANRGDWERTHLLAIEASRKLGDRLAIALTLTNLGNVYSLQKNWEKANECYKESLRIFSELKDRLGVAKTLGNLANVCSQQGYWGKASECYNESLVIFSELNDRYGEAQTLANVGIFHIQQNHQEKAVALWQEALTKLPSNLPKSEQVVEWLESMDATASRSVNEAPTTAVYREVSDAGTGLSSAELSDEGSLAASLAQPSEELINQPTQQRNAYIVWGTVAAIAIAISVLILMR